MVLAKKKDTKVYHKRSTDSQNTHVFRMCPGVLDVFNHVDGVDISNH